jgi:hypothetical protein
MCLMSWATVVGLVRFATDRQRAAWERAYPHTASRAAAKSVKRTLQPARRPVSERTTRSPARF